MAIADDLLSEALPGQVLAERGTARYRRSLRETEMPLKFWTTPEGTWRYTLSRAIDYQRAVNALHTTQSLGLLPLLIVPEEGALHVAASTSTQFRLRSYARLLAEGLSSALLLGQPKPSLRSYRPHVLTRGSWTSWPGITAILAT